MEDKRKRICVRCESLDRKQKSRKILYIGTEKVPLCTVCAEEIAEEEEYFKSLEDRCITEELQYEYGPGEDSD